MYRTWLPCPWAGVEDIGLVAWPRKEEDQVIFSVEASSELTKSMNPPICSALRPPTNDDDDDDIDDDDIDDDEEGDDIDDEEEEDDIDERVLDISTP